jgi:hypothetical protein
MAGRIKLNKALRSIHFFSSVLIFAFALMYILSGLVMVKHKWFPHGEEQKLTLVKPLNYTPDTTDIEELSRAIKLQFDISGRLVFSRNQKKEISLNYYRPGVRNVVTIHNNLDSVTIVRTEKITFGEISTRIHRLHGYQGGVLYYIWAGLLDLTAISMIIFAITGIWLWYRSLKVFKLGWLFILPAIVLVGIMYFYLK